MMRRWLAKKLFDLVAWLDWDETVNGSYSVVFADMIMADVIEMPKKRGRPKGRKDSVGPKPEPKKRGRPLGSKNKPKVQL